MELNPQKIYEDFCNNNLDKISAIKQLIALIEDSEIVMVRLNSIKIIGEIENNNAQIFELLENLLISDSNERVRNAAAEAIKNKYVDKALEPMKYALQHEESPVCLYTIFNSLIEIIKKLEVKEDFFSRSTLINEINNIEDKEFKIGFEISREHRAIENFTNEELAEILINYYTISFLKKVYWRLKYEVENCKIVEIDFIFKGLTILPEAIKNLSSIKTLILRYNQIMSLPEWIGSFKNLEFLNLNVNNLTELPESIGSLSSLKELSLWKNELRKLPKSIGTLLSLENLNLRLNQLEILPESIGNLSSLKELNLHDNKLTFLPRSIGHLSSLEKLNISWNILSEIPDSIGTLKSLKKLDAGRNEIKSIPESIGSLYSLKILDLSENKLIDIPESIGSLKTLEALNLSRNNLKVLPKSLGSLNSLKELYLGENHIVSFSRSLKNLEEKGLRIYF